MKKFCVTTPIYYINGDPHIGHAYASIAADILARFKRLDGFDVHFSTGTDEHGIKVARSAERAGIDIHAFADKTSQRFRDLAEKTCISHDDFIRTTEQRHIEAAQEFWRRLGDDIYKHKYVGWYDEREEGFVAEEDVVNGIAPSGGKVEWMEEESYFFRLSVYQEKLLKYYEEHPDFIAPVSRRNEVIEFVKSGLKDLCISRSKFDWGIPVPDDPKHVMYVWIDALANYTTSLGWPHKDVTDYMSECVHIIGKEILRFHAVYWPAFLMSAGIELPKRLFAHGWWTSEGQKMSKSIGNVVEPNAIIEKYGLDQVRYFLFREVRFGEDGDFSEAALQRRISYDLSNDLGNLVQRVLAFVQKMNGRLTADYNFDECAQNLVQHSHELIEKMRKYIDVQNLFEALGCAWTLVSETNKFINDTKPWELAKQNSPQLNMILTAACEALRAIAFGIAPFMPNTAQKIFGFMNIKGENFSEIFEKFKSQDFPAPTQLFPRAVS